MHCAAAPVRVLLRERSVLYEVDTVGPLHRGLGSVLTRNTSRNPVTDVVYITERQVLYGSTWCTIRPSRDVKLSGKTLPVNNRRAR